MIILDTNIDLRILESCRSTQKELRWENWEPIRFDYSKELSIFKTKYISRPISMKVLHNTNRLKKIELLPKINNNIITLPKIQKHTFGQKAPW